MTNGPHGFSLSLVFNESDSQHFRQLSNDLKLSFGNFKPHLTLVHDDDRLAKPLLDLNDFVIQTHNLYFAKDDKQRIWVGLTVRKTAKLIELQQTVGQLAGVIVDSDAFFPHVTLGCLSQDQLDTVKMSAAADAIVTRQYVGLSLEHCRNGEFGKVVEFI